MGVICIVPRLFCPRVAQFHALTGLSAFITSECSHAGWLCGSGVSDTASVCFGQDMKETIQCLQDQLNLLTVKVKKKFTGLYSASRGLQKPLQSLQEDISR